MGASPWEMETRARRRAPSGAIQRAVVIGLTIVAAGSANFSSASEEQIAQSAAIESISIGIDGKFKVGYWTSCFVTNQKKPEKVSNRVRNLKRSSA